MPRTARLASLAALAGLTLAAFAAPAGASRIEGRITASESGAPLVGVLVVLQLADGTALRTATSAADGTYLATGLADGAWRVHTMAPPPRLNEVWNDVPCDAPAECDGVGGSEVVLVGGGAAGGIDFALDLPGTLSGVIRAAEAPAAGVAAGRVVIGRLRNGVLRETRSVLADAVTGAWLASPLRPGDWRASAEAPGRFPQRFDGLPCSPAACDLLGATPIALASGGTATVDFALASALGTLRVVVRGAGDGAPIAGATVSAWRIGDGVVPGASTDADGLAVLTGLAPGEYTFAVRHPLHRALRFDGLPCTSQACDLEAATRVPVGAGETVERSVALVRASGRLSGRVLRVSTGAPLPAGSVTLRARDEAGQRETVASTDVDGRFDFEAPSGSVLLQAVPTEPALVDFAPEFHPDLPCYAGESCDGAGAVRIDLPSGGARGGLDFGVDRGATLSGRVRGPDGAPALAGTAEVVPVSASPARPTLPVALDAEGRFLFTHLRPGGWRLRARDLSDATGPLVPVWHPGVPCLDAATCASAGSTVFDLPLAGTLDGVEVVAPAGQTLGGRVTVRIGGIDFGAPDVEVSLFTASGARAGTARSAASGHYASGALPAGEYRAAVLGQGIAGQVWNLRDCRFATGCDPVGGDPIVLATDIARRDVDFRLAFPPVVAGRIDLPGVTPTPDLATLFQATVLDAQGAPLPWSACSVTADDAGQLAYRCPVDPGAYRVWVAAPGFIDRRVGGGACEDNRCAPGEGALFEVAAAPGVIDAHVALAPAHLLYVTLTGDGAPLPGAALDLLGADGAPLRQVLARPGPGVLPGGLDLGTAPLHWIDLPAGTWRLRTAAGRPWIDELYDGVPCPDGACDPLAGAALVFATPQAGATRGLAIDLARPDLLFAAGFEVP